MTLYWFYLPLWALDVLVLSSAGRDKTTLPGLINLPQNSGRFHKSFGYLECSRTAPLSRRSKSQSSDYLSSMDQVIDREVQTAHIFVDRLLTLFLGAIGQPNPRIRILISPIQVLRLSISWKKNPVCSEIKVTDTKIFHIGVTRQYNFTISRGTIAPSGLLKTALLVNNQFPGVSATRTIPHSIASLSMMTHIHLAHDRGELG